MSSDHKVLTIVALRQSHPLKFSYDAKPTLLSVAELFQANLFGYRRQKDSVSRAEKPCAAQNAAVGSNSRRDGHGTVMAIAEFSASLTLTQVKAAYPRDCSIHMVFARYSTKRRERNTKKTQFYVNPGRYAVGLF